ncbi:UDP-glucose dehydrogenase family protein [Patescibacteria group bacterium]
MNITVIGTGFVGVVTSAVFAEFSNKVYALDVDEKKIESLSKGEVPFYEPDLKELVSSGLESGNLVFTTSYEQSISDSEVIMISVGTPSAADGTADLKYIKAASQSLAPFIKDNAIIAIKSTVPPGTNDIIKKIIQETTNKNFFIVSLPEFLKEGSAVFDTKNPDRVVIGARDKNVIKKLLSIHKPLGGERIIVTPESAQMAKYSANAYLAQRITFINQIANLCEKNGADVDQVTQVMGADKRIGSHYWYPGLGYGGSCFPKDVKELAAYSLSVGEGDGLFVKLDELNERRIPKLMKKFEGKVGGWEGKTVAILGLSFKPNTDDMREAPSLTVIPILQQKGAKIKVYDPKSTHVAKDFLENVEYSESLWEVFQEVDVAILLIEWDEFLRLDPNKIKQTMKGSWFIDTRNQYNKETIEDSGLKYIGIGANE